MKKKVQFLRGAVFTAILFAAVLSCGGGAGGETTYDIGDRGPGGGIIFYYDAAGFIVNAPSLGYNNKTCYYLEAAPVDIGSLEWASESKKDTTVAAYQVAYGTGAVNTAAILNNDPDAPAAKACAEYTNGGKADDWFLPNTHELTTLWNNRSFVGNFTDAIHWASYQSGDNKGGYVEKDITFRDNKRNPHLVRPIRAF
ncbi:hypothetical protein AGMMS50230_22100 [Spirochaetia bacterium]|nr:hypothetical protein AGMMS50230_22100 [Spirochaetia bacterium]